MNIVVTGGCGYVGSVLVPTLLEHGHDVTVIDCLWYGNHLDKHPKLTVMEDDIRLAPIPKGTETIIHLAAVSNDPSVAAFPKLTWETNVLGLYTVLENAIEVGVKQFIFASSGSVYGISDALHVTETIKPLPMSDYNKTKIISESVLFSRRYDDLMRTALRPGTVCGWSPRLRLDVVANIFCHQAVGSGEIRVLGGEQVRPILPIKDMVGAYLHCINKPGPMRGIYNVGKDSIEVRELAVRVATAATTIGLKVNLNLEPSNDQRSYRLNTTKIQDAGFRYIDTIEESCTDLMQKLVDTNYTSSINNYNAARLGQIIGNTNE